MATTTVAMFRGAASVSNTTLYTVSSTSATAVVSNIAIANSTTSAQTATVNIDTTPIVSAVSIPANSTAFFDIKQTMAASSTAKTITGSASTTGVYFHISGVEIV